MPFQNQSHWTRPHIYAFNDAGRFITNWRRFDGTFWYSGSCGLTSDGWPDYLFIEGGLLPGKHIFPYGEPLRPWSPP